MSTYKIAVFVDSLRAASFNLRLARALEKLAPANFSSSSMSAWATSRSTTRTMKTTWRRRRPS